MKNDLSQSGVAVYTARRRNKSIWMRSSLIVALVVAVLTSYALIFPARTVGRDLICGQTEHSHTEDCWLAALTCGLEEDENHTHSAACYTTVLVCGMEEHVHSDGCYAELAPTTEATEAATEPAATQPEESLPVSTEPEQGTEPAETEPGEIPVVTEPVVTEPDEPVPTEPEPEPVTEPVKMEDTDWWMELSYEGIDLAPYLESAVFQRQQGSVLVEDTVFENGETVKASIVYDIPEQIVTPDCKYVYYALPEGVRPVERTSGDVMDDGVAVGVYTITEDGVIHILFNDDFANGNAIMGTVEFSSWLYANDDGSDRVVEFENGAGTITIVVPDEQRYDLAMEKSGELSSDYSSAEFVLSVFSEKGSGAPITVTDQLTNQTPATLFSAAYDSADFQVFHFDAEGNMDEICDYLLVWGEDGMSFTIDPLPALEAGERYEICYRVELEPDLSGSFELDNEASATAGILHAETSFFITYVCDITKTGSFNPVTGLIDWVITVNPESRPVGGWRIEDDLPYPAVGKVLLTNANGVRYADITPANGRTIRYTFPSNAPARPYFIRYSTLAPTTSETVINSVRLINDRDTTVVSEVEVSERAEGVEKSVEADYLRSNGMVQTYWSFVVSMPAGELESYTFRDLISAGVVDLNQGSALDSGLHFGYAAELDAAFRGNLHLVSDGKSWYYGDPENDYVVFTLSYYDAQGNPIDPADESTPVAHVSFRLNPAKGYSFHGYEIIADDYPTWLDVRGAEIGDYWTYQNNVILPGGELDQVNAYFRKGKAFEKQIKLGSRYADEDVSLSYADCGGELEYRLLLDLDALDDESFTVTDLLPAGMELVEGSPRAYFTGESFHGEYLGIFSRPGSFSCRTEPGEGEATRLIFEGSGVTEAMRNAYAYICIVYRVRLTDDSLWNDYTENTQCFTNNAQWGDFTDSHSVTVHNEPKRLEKTGGQLLDAEGAGLPRIRFSLLINAGAEDLDPERDWITLTDEFSSEISAGLELSSIRLYHYDPSRPDKLGNAVRTNEYSLSYNAAQRRMTVTLPDENAYVMLYDYTVDYTAILDGQTTVSNSASLAGRFHSGTEIALKGVSSSATAWQRVITVTKVDADNNAKVLPGAEFTLEYWDPEAQQWLPAGDSAEPKHYVTDENGKIILNLLGTERDLDSGILYRFTEFRAPVGYDADGTVVWFICMPKGNQSHVQIFEAAGAGSGIHVDDVMFFAPNGGSCFIANPFTGLTVEKRWYEQDGREMQKPMRKYIDVTLYVTTDPSGETGKTLVPADENVANPVRITAEDEWSYTWDALPSQNENGEKLYYFAEEAPVPGFTTSYINNGITGGTIVITNDCEPYELPATGGIGSRQFVGLGVLVMSLTAVVYIITKFKKMEEKQ